MNKKLKFLPLLGIAIVSLFFLFNNRSDSEVKNDPEDLRIYSGEVKVEMNENGFSPRVIRITRGTKVTFINRNEKFWHWPASDFHPAHTLYSEFDPKKAIGPGEEWYFTFDKMGEWDFHDHLAPYITGKIIVVE